jgi:hypothetical protein
LVLARSFIADAPRHFPAWSAASWSSRIFCPKRRSSRWTRSSYCCGLTVPAFVDRPVARDVVQRAGKQPDHSIVADARIAQVAEHDELHAVGDERLQDVVAVRKHLPDHVVGTKQRFVGGAVRSP